MLGAPAWAQTETQAQPQAAARTAGTAIADLYRQLCTVPLDPVAVYKIRDASLDREDLHLSLNDGTIAFTRAVNGRITGALFAGEGEILVVPPDFTERHSLSLFAGTAVLSERITLAYLRFADDSVIRDLNPYLRPPEDAAGFIERNNTVASQLAEADCLRTLIGITYAPPASPRAYAGEFLFGRFNGEKLGGFEVSFDPMVSEQISARQVAFTLRGRHYDLWMSFPMRSLRKDPDPAVPLPHRVIEITDYRIRMDVTPPRDLAGSATLTLKTLQTGPRAVLFELSRYLKLSSIELESAGREPVKLDFIQNEAIEGSQLASRGNDTVTVVFPQPLTAGQTLQLKFTYAGAVMSDAGGGLLYVGARGTWFPNRGPAMSNFDLEFRYPPEWKLLATGKKVSESARDGMQEIRFVSERPVPLAGFNLGRYVETPVDTPATRLLVYSARAMEADFARTQRPLPRPPVIARPEQRRPAGAAPLSSPPPPLLPNPSEKAHTVGRNAADMIEFLTPRIGAFPFSSLSLTQLPGPNSQGWPGLVFLSSYVFLDRTERERSRFSTDEMNDWVFDHVMTEHEVAHQWWGNHVFWDSYRDQWIMEALANYCALLKLEQDDPELLHRILEQYRDDLLEAPEGANTHPFREAGPVRLGGRLNSSRFTGAYDPVIYGRGTWLIHMLREMLKDAAASARPRPRPGAAAPPPRDPDALFYSVLRGIQSRFAGKKISTRDFLAAFERALPPSAAFENRKSLEWFFDGWINGSAIPALKLDNVRITPSGTRTFAAGVIVQADAPGLLVTSVPLYAAGSGKEPPVLVGRVFADGERTEFRLAVPAGTRRILLDPFRAVLRQP